MTDGGGVEHLDRLPPETAREHIRNALTILLTASVECPLTQADVNAIVSRLQRALDQLERGNG
jgi:hypothetical protein